MKTEESELRVLKSGSCPSLSGKSKLGYEIGCGPDSNIQVRVCKNSGTGYFSKDWIGLARVQQVLGKHGVRPITFNTLLPLFQGRSINTAGFLLAVLKHEGLVQTMEGKRRSYECRDATAFVAEVQALMGSPGATPGKVKPAAKKAATKKPKS
jgi:hypothetical protein